ncbi:MAG: hypothetical protein KKH98_02615, partial [Spirochaetes bacterium]|nr:hypothetical protein [Spirochaetota bacterium]
MKRIVILLFIFLNISLLHSEISVKSIKGRVQVLLNSKGAKRWVKADMNMVLSREDRIRTAGNSSIVLRSVSYDIIVLEKSILLLDLVYNDQNSTTVIK